MCCFQCDIVMTLNATDRCNFVKNSADCTNEDGFINYLDLAFCLLPPNIIAFTVTLCVRSLFTSYFHLEKRKKEKEKEITVG